MTVSEIEAMNYSDFVGFIKERNRPSGGIKTVHEVAVNAFIDKSKRMLEIGSNTGFTSVNMSLLTGCDVVGIDVNDNSVREAESYALQNGVDDRVSFVKADALHIPFEDKSFDVVWCSNVTSFISDKQGAIQEYLRVLKPGGVLVVVPIYYISQPPKEIVTQVSEAIESTIEVRDKNYWKDIFNTVAKNNEYCIEQFYERDCVYLDRQVHIDSYIEMLLKKERIVSLDSSQIDVIRKRCEHFYSLFNENLKYAGYSVMLYQKRLIEDETELFLTR